MSSFEATVLRLPVRQYTKIFEISDKQLSFTDEGLGAIADLAIERETGVRALRAILEDILLDLLYELPSRNDTNEFLVDESVVTGEKVLYRGLTAADIADEEEASKPAAEEDSPTDEDPPAERESA